MQTKENLVAPKWKPGIYSKLSFAQNNAASRIFNILKIRKDADILDIGCGDGKISFKLYNIANRGTILGLDKSSEMIDFANSNYSNEDYPNLKFCIKDIQETNFQQTFDLIFSSFALQWIKNKNLFFIKVHKALKENGQMCITMPMGISPELECATKIVTKDASWENFFLNFHPNWYFIKENDLLYLVTENCFKLTYSSLHTEEVSFPSLEDFEKYILLWFPYLQPVRKDLKAKFFSQIITEYCKLLPPKRDGTILMRIPIISIIASKINL